MVTVLRQFLIICKFNFMHSDAHYDTNQPQNFLSDILVVLPRFPRLLRASESRRE